MARRFRELGFEVLVVSHAKLAAGFHLAEVVRDGDVVRLESTGGDLSQERLLLRLGRLVLRAAEDRYLTDAEIDRLPLERGGLPPLEQWYRGLLVALGRVREQRRDCAPHLTMSHEDDVLAMCDKSRTRRVLGRSFVPTPDALGPVASAAELFDLMTESGVGAVFVKPVYGSGGCATVALRRGAGRAIAYTTVERVESRGLVRHFNSRRIRRIESEVEIAGLIDELVPHGLHAERWIPKIGVDGRAFDLRVVVIGGRPMHVLPRLARSPVTNLHLRNERGDSTRIRSLLGEGVFGDVLDLAARAASCWPRSLYMGIDVLVATSRRLFIAEVNAYGDWHEGVLAAGKDTYAHELAVLRRRARSTMGAA